ncbi:MAG: energy-coupled thiamine transporter ThiT [Christensenellaceae bacterium]|nr:energy-coupled thiamine transporter ThiT [Christensenellaceae bacterium]
MFDQTVQMLVWLTATLLVVIIGVGIFLNYRRKDLLPVFGKYALGVVIGYAIATGSILFYQQWIDIEIGDWAKEANVFYPILALFALTIALTIGGIFVSQFKKSILKLYSIISLSSIGVFLLVLLIVLPFRMDDGVSEYSIGDKSGMIVSVIVMATLFVVVPLVFGKKTPANVNIKATVYGAICIALGFSLSYFKLFSLPNGGSITFASLLPIMIYSYMFGIRKGAMVAFMYGMLQFIQEPYFLDPWQFLLEYPLAFGMIGLAGIFHERNMIKKAGPVVQFILGGVSVATLRFICHFIAGMIVWKIWFDPDVNPIAYSLVYNLSYVFPDMLIALVAGGCMFASKSVRNLIDRQASLNEKSAVEDDTISEKTTESE